MILTSRLNKVLIKLFGHTDCLVINNSLVIYLRDSIKLEDLIALKSEFSENYSCRICVNDSQLNIIMEKK